MIELFALVNLVFYLIQLLLGALAWSVRNQRQKKYAFATSEQIEPAILVEKYFYDTEYSFEIAATDDIDEPAEADENYLWVNRKLLNRTDLYSNFYLIYQAELTSDRHKLLRYYNSVVGSIFFFHLFFIILGIFIKGELGLIILVISLLANIIYAVLWVLGNNNQMIAIEKSLKIASSVMQFDEVEKARVRALASDIRYELLEYPWEIYWRIWVFFTP
jgi:hypothetical protein